MAQQKKLLGQILEQLRFATKNHVKVALQSQLSEKGAGKKLGDILQEMEVITPEQLAQALAVQFDRKYISLASTEILEEIVKAVPKEIAEEHLIMPVKKNGSTLTIAMTDPLDVFTLDNLRFILNTDIDFYIATKKDVQEAIKRYYGSQEKGQISDLIEQATMTQTEIQVRGLDIDAKDSMDDADAPVIKFVQLMLTEAVKARASDVHVEPMADRLRVRYRIDGVCSEVQSPPKRLQGAVLSRIKIMGGMDIAEKRKPQDGRIRINTLGRELDIRVSSIPATHGESIVMRLLDKQSGLVGLDELGFHGDDYKRFKAIIKRPNGIFLVTGPTGSGKTTTLYAALKDLNRPDVKIITAENPVEYNMAGINQAQVKANIGFTFSRIIRAMLRQAPNIILVGEIRDLETAEIAIQAALTGHLVFSTLHTNDAPGALTRLLDMGIKPFLVASSIQGVMGQRLVRMLCDKCKEPEKHDPARLMAVGLRPEDVQGKTIYKAVGCNECKFSGYLRRKGIFELMELNASIRELVFNKSSIVKIREQARLNGMVTLQEDGVRKILEGKTTLDEIISITHRSDIAY